MLAGLALTGAAVMARQGGLAATQEPARSPEHSWTTAKRRPTSDSADQPGEKAAAADPAIAEIDELRTRLIQAAKRDWTTTLEEFQANRASLDRIYQASRRLMSAEEDGRRSVADQAAASAHADRMREVARIENSKPSRTESLVSQVAAYAAEAELWRAQASARYRATAKAAISRRQARPHAETMIAKGAQAEAGSQESPRPGQDPRSQQIIARLGDLVPMKFVEETPLEDIIKHIRQATKSSDMPSGIPIYVDPIGLSEADKTLTSTVRGNRPGRSSTPSNAATGTRST